MNQRFTQLGIEWVDGVRKWILSEQTVAQTDTVMRIIVKAKYIPNKGITSDVDGIVSIRTDKKNMSETSMDMVSVT